MNTAAYMDLLEELEGVQRGNRDLLNIDRRIGGPIQEAIDALKTKIADRISEGKP